MQRDVKQTGMHVHVSTNPTNLPNLPADTHTYLPYLPYLPTRTYLHHVRPIVGTMRQDVYPRRLLQPEIETSNAN